MSDKKKFILFRFLFFFLQAPIGIVFPFFVLHLRKEVGLSELEISYITACSGLTVILFQQFWGYTADLLVPKKILLITNALLSAMLFYIAGRLTVFWQILLCMFLFNTLYTSMIQLLHAFLFTHPRSVPRFGPMRAYASLGFITANVGIGIASDRIFDGSLWFIFPTFVAAAVVSCMLMAPIPEASARTESRPTFLDVQRFFLRKPAVVFFLFVVFFYQAGHVLSYALQSVLMMNMGADMRMISFSYSLAALFELPIFFAANHLFRRFGEVRLMIFAALVQTVRWILVWRATSPTEVIIVSTLHCITFGLFYAASVSFMNRHAGPVFKTSAQTLFAFVYNGFAVLFGNIVGGQITDGGALAGLMNRFVVEVLDLPNKGGLHNLYIFCSMTAAISLVLSFGLLRLDRNSPPTAVIEIEEGMIDADVAA